MTKLAQEQIDSCADLLSQLEPGFLPLEIFNQIARLIRLPMVIVIPIKIEGEQLEVGLIKRASDDLWWPNMWHLPGTVFRSTDTMESCIQRLLDNEVHIDKSNAPIFRSFLVHRSERGAEVIFIYSAENCELKPSSELKWFPVNTLPNELIETERKVIKELQKYFEEA